MWERRCLRFGTIEDLSNEGEEDIFCRVGVLIRFSFWIAVHVWSFIRPGLMLFANRIASLDARKWKISLRGLTHTFIVVSISQ